MNVWLACMDVHYVRPEMGITSQARVTDVCKAAMGCWDPKPGLLAKQYCAVSLALDLPFLEFYDKMKHIELV